MKLINIEDIKKNSYFAFTKIENLDSISKIGLTTEVEKRENEAPSDKNKPAIYFSVGFEGLLKTLDVFIRWEYDQKARELDYPTGDIKINQELMNQVFEKVYNDHKNRVYIKMDLIEGNDPSTSDFSFSEPDFKKVMAINKGYIKSSNMKWEWGPYSNLDSTSKEDWNMFTHIGKRTIEPNRLSILVNNDGKLDALSIIMCVREIVGDNLELENLDEFLEYVRQKN